MGKQVTELFTKNLVIQSKHLRAFVYGCGWRIGRGFASQEMRCDSSSVCQTQEAGKGVTGLRSQVCADNGLSVTYRRFRADCCEGMESILLSIVSSVKCGRNITIHLQPHDMVLLMAQKRAST